MDIQTLSELGCINITIDRRTCKLNVQPVFKQFTDCCGLPNLDLEKQIQRLNDLLSNVVSNDADALKLISYFSP